MRHEIKRSTVGAFATVALALAVQAPAADAGGVPPSKGVVGIGNIGGEGVAPLDDGPRYVTEWVGNGTLVLRISQADGPCSAPST